MIKPNRHPLSASPSPSGPPRYVRKDNTVWLWQIAIAMITVILLGCTVCSGLGCGLNLATQTRLTKLADLATNECKTIAKPCPDMVNGKEPACVLARSRCELALECAKRANAAQIAIQTLQSDRASGQATMDQTAAAAGLDATAQTYCAAGGWH